MSDRDRGEESHSGGLGALLATGALILVIVYAAYKEHYAQQRVEAARVVQEQAIATCKNSVDAVALPSCIENLLSASERAPYTEYDLQAQQDMALWAAMMFVVTGLGVIYVAMTLRATQEATVAAIKTTETTRDIGEAQVRAYVATTSAEYANDQFACIAIKLKIKNFGQSPAHIINLRPVFTFMVSDTTAGEITRFAFVDFDGEASHPRMISAGAEIDCIVEFRWGGLLGTIPPPFTDEIRSVSVIVTGWHRDVFKKLRMIEIDVSEEFDYTEGLPRTAKLNVATNDDVKPKKKK